MKISLNMVLGIVVAALIAILCFAYSREKKLKEQLETSKINELAYISERDSLKNKSIEFKYTIDELKSNRDSLVSEMMKVKKELSVKDKELLALSYLASHASINDSIAYLKDTIFVKDTQLDTTIHNEWYDISLGLHHPSTVNVGVCVPSEKYIVTSYNKVLLNPTGCWLKDLFKKKSKVIEVEVVEKNPYIKSDNQKFIEIVK